MKNFALSILAVSLSISCTSTQQKAAQTTPVKNSADTYAATITEPELKEYLYTYASDEFEGRNTGEPGQKKAVEYIKNYYQSIGVPGAMPNGDYFQKVPIEIAALPEAQLELNNNTYTIGEDFVTYNAPENVNFNTSEIVFLGYGIEDENYSDYNSVDVSGKLLLIMSGEPKDENGNYLVSGSSEPSKWSNRRQAAAAKLNLAQEKGAAGILFFDAENFDAYKRQYDYMKKRGNKGGRMSLKDNASNFFYLLISENVAKSILPEVKANIAPKTINANVAITLKGQSKEIDTENVVAVIKGSEKPNEYIVISSHLDHVGVNDKGEIYNGADDDGSGTVAMLEIAEAFKKAVEDGNGPKRSVVLLHVTGEEKGLLGSRYYTDHDPIFPLENTVANLNIDMIGRIDPKREGNRNYIYLIGSDKLSTDLHELSEAVNQKCCNIELDYKYNDENDPNRFYYRSDHYNFAKNNVPIIFYFNGTHADYHKPSDTPDKINYDLLTNRTKLIFYTAWEIANREQRIVVDKAKTTK